MDHRHRRLPSTTPDNLVFLPEEALRIVAHGGEVFFNVEEAGEAEAVVEVAQVAREEG